MIVSRTYSTRSAIVTDRLSFPWTGRVVLAAAFRRFVADADTTPGLLKRYHNRSARTWRTGPGGMAANRRTTETGCRDGIHRSAPVRPCQYYPRKWLSHSSTCLSGSEPAPSPVDTHSRRICSSLLLGHFASYAIIARGGMWAMTSDA